MLSLTLFLMEQSSANEKTREEIEIEPFQNEELMDDILITKISIENLSLETKASRAFESNDERLILNLHKLQSLKGEMQFVGLSMWSMIINQWMTENFKS